MRTDPCFDRGRKCVHLTWNDGCSLGNPECRSRKQSILKEEFWSMKGEREVAKEIPCDDHQWQE